MERIRVIVAFGDILGFGTWRRRAATTPEVSTPFLRTFYEEIQEFKARHKCIYLKYLGDGMMLIKEIPENGRAYAVARNFVRDVGVLNARLLRAVHACAFPAPEGFRTRITAGHVDKIMMKDPITTLPCSKCDVPRLIPEYVGYCVNLAQRLLQIAPNTPLICHDSVIDLIGTTKKPFKIRHLLNTPERPRGVDGEDIAGLWVVEFA